MTLRPMTRQRVTMSEAHEAPMRMNLFLQALAMGSGVI